jgi:serine/threonine protein kinase
MNESQSAMPTNQPREEALFRAAVELPPGAARRAFLDQACAGDAALHQRLDLLLAAHDAPDALLPETGPAVKATLKIDLPEAPDEAVGQTLGRYKLMERLGEGGGGIVYVAEQTEPVRRRVALKVIKLGMDTKAVVARFEAERQALAMMDHPNIAKVLDAGATDQGRPFFVMELVRGIRITDYCDQNQLSTKERLELFIKVCQAIQHAHQKGIIHRDIKPSNILVTLHDGVPVPKVIDFGIAKATEGRLTDATVYTQLHQFIGTPAYMSPEQAEMSGLDIDTRSDIYSLGVVLYELLAGSTPFDPNELMASGIDGMRKTIREKEPVRPSTRFATLKGEELTTTAKRRSADKSKLMHQLKGDLDWIVMKCLEKDRTRRYETANGLAADLKRHLNNEPIVARPPSSAYRFQKMIRRNKLAFAAAGAVAAALVIGLVVSVFLYLKENQAYNRALAARHEADIARENESRQRQQADAARRQAENLVTFMIQDLQPALKDYGRLSLLKQVDEKTVDYFTALSPDLHNAGTELGQADAIEALAEILQSAGDMKAAAAKFQEALALYQGLAEKHPEIPEAEVGELTCKWSLKLLGPPPSSAELDIFQQDILHRWRELSAKHPENLKVRTGLGGALWDRASFAAQRFNKPQEAITAGLELQEYVRGGMAKHPENKHLAAAYAGCLGVLAIAYQAVGEQGKAVQVSEAADAFYDQALKADPGNLRLLADAADAARNLSYRVSSISPERSRDAEWVARERYRTLTTLDPANADWRYNYALTHMMECYYLEANGQIEAARQALKKFDSLIQNLTLKPWDESKLADNSIELARLAASAGDNAEARAHLAVGESRFQAHYDKLPVAPIDRLQARIRWLNAESQVFYEMHDWAELGRTARTTLAAIDDGLGQRPGDSELLLRRAVARSFLGMALLGRNNAPEALPVLEKSVAGYHDTPPAMAFMENRHSYMAKATAALAEALAKTGNRERAGNLAESVLTDWEAAVVRQPENWSNREELAKSLILLAGMLDPAKAADAARRRSLLDRAAAILKSPESQGRLTVDDKEALAKIESLRAAAGTKEMEEIKPP